MGKFALAHHPPARPGFRPYVFLCYDLPIAPFVRVPISKNPCLLAVSRGSKALFLNITCPCSPLVCRYSSAVAGRRRIARVDTHSGGMNHYDASLPRPSWPKSLLLRCRFSFHAAPSYNVTRNIATKILQPNSQNCLALYPFRALRRGDVGGISVGIGWQHA